MVDVYTHRDTVMHGLQVLRIHGLAESPIINAPPGSGKTYITTKLVNKLYKDHGIPTLYFVLNHDAERIVDGRQNWGHWEGHGRICDIAGSDYDELWSKGYTPSSRHDGDCEYLSQFTSDRPTMAPIQYLFGNDQMALSRQYSPKSVEPLRPEVAKFPLRIIDEFALEQFVKGYSITEEDFNRVSTLHPSPVVRKMCRAIAEGIMLRSDYQDELSGIELGSQFLVGVRAIGEDPDTFLAELQKFSENPLMEPWEDDPPSKLPLNFAPYLVPILLYELQSAQRGNPFNPRIEIKFPQSKFLEIRWRRPIEDIRPTLVLDATSQPELAERALSGHNYKAPRNLSMPIPEGVEMYQYVDDRVTRGSMGLYGSKTSALKPKLFAGIVRDLHRLNPEDGQIGIVTKFSGYETWPLSPCY